MENHSIDKSLLTGLMAELRDVRSHYIVNHIVLRHECEEMSGKEGAARRRNADGKALPTKYYPHVKKFTDAFQDNAHALTRIECAIYMIEQYLFGGRKADTSYVDAQRRKYKERREEYAELYAFDAMANYPNLRSVTVSDGENEMSFTRKELKIKNLHL